LFPTFQESLLKLQHKLIRMKVIREHLFGQVTLGYRLLHIRPLSGFVLSAPSFMFVLWYSGLAISTHLRQDSAVKADEPLTPELFQLHLHDRLVADYRRLRMPEPRVHSELPTYNLVVNNDRLSQLDLHFPPDEGRVNYVDALLETKNRIYDVDVRYRGTKHWHWNNPQKSWKVRVKDNHLMFEGLPTFNFVNTPDPMPFYEQIVLDIARDAGLLTPAYYPFRLQLNRAFLGVYFFEAQPDEGLLRRSSRMPGSIYSGQGAPLNPNTGVSSLWDETKSWKKVASFADGYEQDMSELDGLLKAVHRDTAREFAAFAETTIDVERFATLDALDVVFGNNQHDYDQNHKLYFDPYKNRFEPIATDFRDMEHERLFNRTEHPLLLRLKQLPSYVSRRNRKVYEFLSGPCSRRAISALSEHWTELLQPDQARDPYWDAFDLLPVMGPYYRQLVRPMTEEHQAQAARARLIAHGARVEYLTQELERLDLSATLFVPSVPRSGDAQGKPAKHGTRHEQRTAPASHVAVLDVTVGGPSAFEWQTAVPQFASGCTPSEWQLYADRDLDQTLSPEHDLRLPVLSPPSLEGKPNITLYPGVVLSQTNVNPNRGRVRADAEARRYRFFVRSAECEPTGVTLVGRNSATLGAVSISALGSEAVPSREPTSCNDSSGFIESNTRSLHPFCYPLDVEQTVHLGPGVVELKTTQIYSKHETLVIAPGTTIRAAKGASLITYGKLLAEGTPTAKIRFLPADDDWGGIALQGSGTAGSRISYVEITGGTKPEWSFYYFPGMVNIHDTRDIQVSFVDFSHNHKSDDALHAAYVDGLFLHDATFREVASDAVDLEFTRANVVRLDVVHAGDDGLDLMSSNVQVSGSRLVRCAGNGISIGERSDVTASRTLMARGRRGILIKNDSTLNASEILAYGNDVGIRLEDESLWYVGTSRLRLDAVHVVKTARPFDGSKTTTTGDIVDQLQGGALDDLRRDTLEIPEWSALESMLDRVEQRRAP
jgi:hypothetical protein